MRIGFPVVISGDGPDLVVNVFIVATRAVKPSISLKVVGEASSIGLIFESFEVGPYRDIVKSLMETGQSIEVLVEGGTLVARQKIFEQKENHATKLWITGPSGTLALWLLLKLTDEIQNSTLDKDVLLSGWVEPQSLGSLNWTVRRLSPSNKDTETKVLGTKEDLWLHKEDFDSLDKSLQLDRVRPFEPYKGRLDWLLREFCDQYFLGSPPSEAAQQDDSCDIQETERDLFEAAISKWRLEDRDQALNAHFNYCSPRNLLPIQSAALNPNTSRFVFYTPELENHSELRHVLISGPTGCGKTTLLHSLVLNGLHNRGGGVLYVGPMKALVEEFYETFLSSLKDLLPTEGEQRILLSTGDFSKNDVLISQGRFGLGCLVNEKANALFSADEPEKLMESLSLVIIDEIHMLRDQSRGGVIDMLLAKVLLQAQERRLKNGNRPIQLVLVSTESMAESVRNMSAFRTDEENDSDAFKPILLQTRDRPIPAKHRIAVIYEKRREGEDDYCLRDIVEFKSNDQRQLTLEKREELKNTLGPRHNERQAWKDRISEHELNLEGQLHSLILDRRQEHKVTIVAINGIERINATANALTKRLDHRLHIHEVESNFVEEINRSGLSKVRIKEMLKWASHGVYVHNSQLPKRLRAAIEAIFRNPLQPNSRHKILLATETLTYGVNLTASCVILSNLVWKRDDPMDPFVAPVDLKLDTNQYHNLLGRAGRKGLMAADDIAEAIVCIGMSKFETPAKRAEFLEDYYSASVSPVLFSSIAQPKDLVNLKYDHSQKKYLASKPFELTKCSFTAFRSAIDALRTAGKSASMEDVFQVSRLTTCYQACELAHDQTTAGKLLGLFELIISKASDYKTGEIRLVNQIDDNIFSVTPAACALIDTGTSLHSVEPMAIWLEALRKNFEGENVWAEAVLPGLIVAPDFTKIACELVPGVINDKAPITPAVAQNRLSEIKKLALPELDRIHCSGLVAVIDEFLKNPKVISSLRLIRYSDKIPIVFWQLLTASLRWLRGCHEDEIAKPLMLFNNLGKKRWQPKHADRLEQLSKMCYKFFSQSEGYLSNQQKLKLPQLAVRIKHGIPFSATPYLNVFSSDGVLPRDAVVALHEAVPDPFKLMHGKGVDLSRIQNVIQHVPCNIDDSTEVTKVVRKAYAEYCSSFLNTIDKAEARVYIESVRNAMQLDRQAFSPDWNANVLMVIEQDHQSLEDAGLLGECSADSMTFEDATSGAVVSFFSGAQALGKASLTIKILSWHDAVTPLTWSITPCAYVLIVSLLLRRCITIADVIASITQARPVRIDVYWVASELWQTQSLAAMDSLREGLLGFIEPMQSGDLSIVH